MFSREVKLSTHSSLVLVSYLYICSAAHSRRLHVSSQRASVSEPVCTSNCFGFMFVGAKEDGGHFGICAEEA